MGPKCQFCPTGWIGGANRCAICGREAAAVNMNIEIKQNLPDGFDAERITKAVTEAAEQIDAMRAAPPPPAPEDRGPPVPPAEPPMRPPATLPDGRLLGTDDKANNRLQIALARAAAELRGIPLDGLVVAVCPKCRKLQTATGKFDECAVCDVEVAWQMPFLDFEARYGVPMEIAVLRTRIARTIRHYAPLLARELMDDGDLAGAGELLAATAAMGKVLGQ